MTETYLICSVDANIQAYKIWLKWTLIALVASVLAGYCVYDEFNPGSLFFLQINCQYQSTYCQFV